MDEVARSLLHEYATAANTHHQGVTAGAERMAWHAAKAGDALAKAKDMVPHGQWLAWLAEHFDGTPRTAQTYMRISREAWKVSYQAAPEGVNAINVQTVGDVPGEISCLSVRAAVREISAATRRPKTKRASHSPAHVISGGRADDVRTWCRREIAAWPCHRDELARVFRQMAIEAKRAAGIE